MVRSLSTNWSPEAIPSGRMRIWTVQPALVWERLQQVGELLVDGAEMDDGYVPESYRWLGDQLKARLPDYRGGLPWFCYCAKPDLRWVRHRRCLGEYHVRLELEPRPGTSCVVPSWAWDYVFCEHYLALTGREYRAWTTSLRRAVPDADEWPPPEPWRSELEASWSRLFRADLPLQGWARAGILGVCAGQEAMIGSLRLDEVRHVTPFIGASRRWVPYKSPPSPIPDAPTP